jgi:hypothetical protein
VPGLFWKAVILRELPAASSSDSALRDKDDHSQKERYPDDAGRYPNTQANVILPRSVASFPASPTERRIVQDLLPTA